MKQTKHYGVFTMCWYILTNQVFSVFLILQSAWQIRNLIIFGSKYSATKERPMLLIAKHKLLGGWVDIWLTWLMSGCLEICLEGWIDRRMNKLFIYLFEHISVGIPMQLMLFYYRVLANTRYIRIKTDKAKYMQTV